MVGDFYLRQNPATKIKIFVDASVLSHQSYHLIVSRKVKNHQGLVMAFNEGLKRVARSGQLERFQKRLDQGYYDN